MDLGYPNGNRISTWISILDIRDIRIHAKWITIMAPYGYPFGYPLISYQFKINIGVSMYIRSWSPHGYLCLSKWWSSLIFMDICSDILHDLQPGYPAGFQLYHRDQNERKTLLAWVYTHPRTSGMAASAAPGLTSWQKNLKQHTKSLKNDNENLKTDNQNLKAIPKFWTLIFPFVLFPSPACFIFWC